MQIYSKNNNFTTETENITNIHIIDKKKHLFLHSFMNLKSKL